MNKSELVDEIVTKTNLPRKRAEDVVNLVFDEMTAALAKGDRIEIRGFGSFVSKHRRARTGRKPPHRRRHPGRREAPPVLQGRQRAPRARQRKSGHQAYDLKNMAEGE